MGSPGDEKRGAVSTMAADDVAIKGTIGPDASTFELYVPSTDSINISGRHFTDPLGRVLGLRGANVGSASKVPSEKVPVDRMAENSYVNRPFPLDEAPQHWARLKSWGLTFIRINVTWDAVEHAGPGQYDKEYLAYLRALLESLRGTGLVAYVDVWSRASGGSGAPAWTLTEAGFDLSDDGAALEASGAAYLHGIRSAVIEGERGLWPTGYQKLACATMNTLFWGGDTFAPRFKIRGVPAQEFLQSHFLRMWKTLVDAVGDLETVMGFEMLNEPHPGYISIPTIRGWNYNTDLHLGQYPTPLEGMAMGAGHPTEVASYVRSWPHPTKVSHRELGNSDGIAVWSKDGPTGGRCLWEAEGVWSWSAEKKRPVALQEDYFTKDRSGRPINWYSDCYFPLIKKWEGIINGVAPGKARMIEPLPNEFCPVWPEQDRPNHFVFAPHWYDLHALFNKAFGTMTVNVQGAARGKFILKCLYFGKQVKDNYALQIRNIVTEARKKIGEVPVCFTEVGIPMDMNKHEAFTTGDWKWQNRMMDALISALESSLVHFSLWAYNPHNTDSHGDDWNSENFSWYSDAVRKLEIENAPESEKSLVASSPDSGGRLLGVVVRPYAVATAGQPLSHAYQAETGLFTYRWRDSPNAPTASGVPAKNKVTEIYLPNRVYAAAIKNGTLKHFISPGGRYKFDTERQRMWVWFEDDSFSVKQGKEKIRRLDVWVSEPEEDTPVGIIVGLLLILGMSLFVLGSEVSRIKYGKAWVDLPLLAWEGTKKAQEELARKAAQAAAQTGAQVVNEL